jgi:hypothetical protein
MDRDDGSYYVTYQVPEQCRVAIEIKLRNERGELQPIRSCTKEATFEEGVQASVNQFLGKNTMFDLGNTMQNFEMKINSKKAAINIKDKNVQDDVKKLLEVM